MAAQIDSSPCPQPFWLPGGHLQTIHGALVARYHHIAFVRDRVDTPDGDFIDFDWVGPRLFPNKSADNLHVKPDPQLAATAARRWMQESDWASLPSSADTSALILFHGLEGGSGSHYAQAISQYFRARGWVVVIAHLRGCSGFANRMARAYYSGDSDDLQFMLNTAQARLPQAKWHAVGVSLGGNAMLKCLGERPELAQRLEAAAAVSVPLDLVACGAALSDTILGRRLYGPYFLRTMKRKVLDKTKRFPGSIDMLRFTQSRTLREFDDIYTAPMHGFKNALDYWTRASSKPWLKHLAVPTLVLNARNDPFVPAPSLPDSQECSDTVLLHQPAEGGHMGFVSGPFPGHLNWLPQRIARYFETRL